MSIDKGSHSPEPTDNQFLAQAIERGRLSVRGFFIVKKSMCLKPSDNQMVL